MMSQATTQYWLERSPDRHSQGRRAVEQVEPHVAAPRTRHEVCIQCLQMRGVGAVAPYNQRS